MLAIDIQVALVSPKLTGVPFEGEPGVCVLTFMPAIHRPVES